MNTETDTATPAILDDLDRLWGAVCVRCSLRVPGPEIVFSIVLGFKDHPRCLDCLASEMESSCEEYHERILRYVKSRDCYRQAWENAVKRERCSSMPSKEPCESLTVPLPPPEAFKASSNVGEIKADVFWDAGDLACGDLVLALRGKLLSLPAGTVLHLVARDPAAPEDLPAWCRLTGHRLLHQQHPVYFLQRKGV